MAKKKGSSRPSSRPPSRTGSERDLEEASACSTGRLSGFGAEFETDELLDDPFAVAVEQLYEKRTSTREQGLQALVRLLASDVQYEECMLRVTTFSQMFLGSLKRGGPTEASLAARALGLHLVTLGASDEAEGIYKDALPVLEPVLLTNKSAATRAAGADALTAACFVGAEGPHETLECMTLLAKAFSKPSQAAQVLVSAVRGWTVLLTTVPAWQLDSGFVEVHLSVLHSLLHSEDVDVRSAAGEAVALLYDACSLTTLPQSPRLPPRSTPQQQPSGASHRLPLSNGSNASSNGRPPLPPARNGSTPARKQLDMGNEPVTNGSSGPEAGPTSAAAAPQAEEEEVGSSAGGEQQQADETAATVQQQLQLAEGLPEGEHAEAEEEEDEQQEEGLGEHGLPSPQSPLPPLRMRQRQAGTSGRTPAKGLDQEGGGSAGGVAVERLEDIVTRMRDLAKNKGDAQRKSKADRRELRSTFRGLVDMVEDGSVTAQKVKLRHGDVLTVDTLPGIIRLNFFRRLLADGFQAHLHHNTLLHQVFNFRPRGEPQERLSTLEKRLLKGQSSVESKERTRQRKAERQMMHSYKGAAFLHGD